MSPSMLEALRQILETNTFDRVEVYRKGKMYLWVFVAGQEEFAWNGPATDQSPEADRSCVRRDVSARSNESNLKN